MQPQLSLAATAPDIGWVKYIHQLSTSTTVTTMSHRYLLVLVVVGSMLDISAQ